MNIELLVTNTGSTGKRIRLFQRCRLSSARVVIATCESALRELAFTARRERERQVTATVGIAGRVDCWATWAAWAAPPAAQQARAAGEQRHEHQVVEQQRRARGPDDGHHQQHPLRPLNTWDTQCCSKRLENKWNYSNSWVILYCSVLTIKCTGT